MVAAWIESVETWAERRFWLPRGVVLAGLLWLGVSLTFQPDRSTIFHPIDLGIHEAGHLLFRFGGDFVCAFGGTLLQCLAPVLAGVALARRPDWFGVAFCAFWLGVNLYDVARYMADARAQVLQLVTVGGGDAKHDWNLLFGELGLLGADTTIAGLTRVVAFLVLWSGLAAAGWMVVVMARRGGASASF